MSPLLIAGLCAVTLGTGFLSGVFGMAGGRILVGVLLSLMPLPAAMALHAITQIASKVWRGLLWWRYVCWTAAWPYVAGSVLALGAWSLSWYVPGKPVAFLLLGMTPFVVRPLPPGLSPNPERLPQELLYGSASMTLLLLTGVSGPLVNTFPLGGKLDRREIVATEAICQVAGHGAKLAYVAAIIDQAALVSPSMTALAVASSVAGTTLARRLLGAMTDVLLRLWANRPITAMACYDLIQGGYLVLLP